MPSGVKRRHCLGALPGLLVSAEAAAAALPLRVGSSAALSGPARALGLRLHAGAAACVERVNQSGGVHGARLAVDLRDDGYEPARTEVNTRALIEDPGVLALFGFVGTPTSAVALPQVKRAGLPFIGAFTGADILHDPRLPQVFNVRASYRAEALALAAAMRRAGARRVGVLYQADLFGRAGLEAMRDALAASGLELGGAATVKRNTTAVDEAVQLILRGAQRVDAVYMVSTYESCAAFVVAARAVGFEGGFYTLSFAGLEPLDQALGPRGRGLTISQVVADPRDASLPVVAAYQEAMRQQGDTQWDSISLEGFIAARVLVEGLRRAGPTPTRASLYGALDDLGRLDLGGHSVEYRPGERIGSRLVRLVKL